MKAISVLLFLSICGAEPSLAAKCRIQKFLEVASDARPDSFYTIHLVLDDASSEFTHMIFTTYAGHSDKDAGQLFVQDCPTLRDQLDRQAQSFKNLNEDDQKKWVDAHHAKPGAPTMVQFKATEVRAGVELLKVEGYSAVNLKAPNLDFQQGGTVTVVLLRNGFTGKTNNFNLTAVRSGGVWQASTEVDRKRLSFRGIFLDKNLFCGGLVGIKSVRVIP